MSDNWASDTPKNILIGLQYLPTPIVNHMRRSMHSRPRIRHVYHVTELLYCLRKAYVRRNLPSGEFNVSSLWNIYRGVTFDEKFTPLFKINQKTYKIEREHLTITGTLDFAWIDEEDYEKVLYDLKMPKNVYYKKKSGAGKFYTEQVQSYLGMAHVNGELMDYHRARVMMLADDLVIEEIQEKDEILEYLWTRAFLLDKALETNDPSILPGPEEEWECRDEFCEAPVEFKILCKDIQITSEKLATE